MGATGERAGELRSSLVDVRREEEDMTGGSYIQINISGCCLMDRPPLHSRLSARLDVTALPSRTFLKKLTSNAPGLSLSSATRRPGSPLGGHSARSCGRNAWLMVGSALPVAVKLNRR